MAITRKVLKSGKVSWGYLFSVGPREAREQHQKKGFASRKLAEQAEAAERLEAASQPTPSAHPKTLGQVIGSFIEDRAPELSAKTVQRYREMVPYLSAELMAQPIRKVTALMLHAEWTRLHESGGRGKREGQPLTAKTVKNIAGLVSSAFSWAILYELVTVNPTTASRPPRNEGRKSSALAPSQQDIAIESAGTAWGLSAFLGVCAGLGARRGEVLALRWCDLRDGNAVIGRSLCQVKQEVTFKTTKSKKPRIIAIPERTRQILAEHRRAQEPYRLHFGTSYRRDLDLIFCTESGETLKPDSVSSAVSTLFRRLKMAGSLHTLRHSHGSQLLAAGVPLAEVSARLGHTDPGTTLRIYTHEIPGSQTAAEVWESVQPEKRKEKRQ